MTNISTLLPTVSRYRTLYAAASVKGSPLADALETLPGWRAARDRLIALGPARLNDDWSAEAASHAAVDDLLRAAADSGKQLTSTDLQQEAVRLYNEAMGSALIAASVSRLRATFTDELDLQLVQNFDSIFVHLNAALGEMLTEGRELSAKLTGVTDVEAAVDADLVEEFRRFRQLGEEYGRLRYQQSVVFTATESEGRAMHAVPTAYLAAPPAADPDYIARMLHAPVLTSEGRQRPANAAPWPEDWKSAEAFAWVLAHPEAKPWVPTRAELAEADERIEVEMRRARAEMNERRSSAINPNRNTYLVGTAGIA